MLMAICFLFCSSVAIAEGAESILPRHAFDIGLGVAYLDYDEDSIDVEIAGPMFDVVGSYTYHNGIMMNASLEYSRGDLEYNGETYSGIPVETDTQDWKVECRCLIGCDFLFRENHIVTPFLGLGYRYWNDEVEGAGGYGREIEYWYSPIGLKTHSHVSGNWTWGMTLEYDLFWYGKVKTGRIGFPNPELDQEGGYGVRFSCRLRRQLTNDRALSVEPHIRYWRIEESERAYFSVPGPEPGDILVAGFVEPENETTSYGLRIIYEF